MTNAEARFNNFLRPRKPEGSLGRTAQDVHLDSHTAPELCGLGCVGCCIYLRCFGRPGMDAVCLLWSRNGDNENKTPSGGVVICSTKLFWGGVGQGDAAFTRGHAGIDAVVRRELGSAPE